jgi:hypothetical protein
MAGYAEIRPAFLGEVVTLTATVEGSGSIAAWEFAGALYDPAGSEVEDAVAVEILDADDRTLTVTVAGQEDVGDHRLVVTRTDDDSGLVVFRGVLEVTDPAVP